MNRLYNRVIFKTFDSDSEKISSKIGMFGKSFEDIGGLFKGNTSKKNIQSQMIDVDALYPQMEENQSKNILSKLQSFEKQVQNSRGNVKWDDYFSKLGEGDKWQKDFVQNTDLQKASAEDVAKAYDAARESAVSHNSALKKQTISAKAGSMALSGLASIGNSFASWAVDTALSAAVQGIQDLANESENARQRSEAYLSSVTASNEQYANNLPQIQSLESEYDQLSKGVGPLGENQSFPTESYERYKTVVSEISNLLPDLAVRYNEQGEKIGFVTGKLKDLTGEYQKSMKSQAREAYFSGDEEGGSFSDVVDAYNKESSISFGEGFGNIVTFNADDNVTNLSRKQALEARADWDQEDFKKEYEDYVNEATKSGYRGNTYNSGVRSDSDFGVNFDELGIGDYIEILTMDENEFEAFKEKMAALQENYEEGMEQRASDIGTGLTQFFHMKDSYWNIEDEGIRASIDSTFGNMTYDFVQNLDVMDEDGEVDGQKMEAWANSFIRAMSSNKDGIANAWSELMALDVSELPVDEAAERVSELTRQIAQSAGGAPAQWAKILGFEQVGEYSRKLQGNISDISHDNSDDSEKLKTYTKDFTPEQTDAWLEATSGSQNADEAIQKYEKYLADTARPFSEIWDSEEFASSKEALLELAKSGELTSDVLKSNEAYAELLNSVGNNADEAAEKINHMVSSTDQLANMKTGISSISNVLTQKRSNLSNKETKHKGVGIDTLTSMPDEVKKSTKEYEKFVSVLGNGKSSMAQCQKAANELAGAYVNSHGFLSNLTEENQDYYKSILDEMGVENSSSVIKQALANSTNTLSAEKEYASQTGQNLAEQSAEEIAAFATQQSYSDSLTMSLYQLALQKQLINGTTLDFSSDIGAISELVSNIGGATTSLDLLNKIKNGEANYIPSSEYNKILEAAQKEVEEAQNKKSKGPKIKINSSSDPSSKNKTTSPKQTNQTKQPKQTKQKTEYDWLETRLNNISKAAEKAKSAIERMFDLKSKSSKIRKALKAVTKEISSNEKAASRYMKRANKTGLNKKYKTLVKKGKIGGKKDIENITSDSKLQKKIEKYKTLYEKAQNCKNSIDGLISTVQDLSKSLAEIPLEKAEKKIEKLDKASALAGARGANKKSAKEKNVQINAEITNLKSNTAAQKEAAQNTKKNVSQNVKSARKASYKGLKKKDKKEIKKLLKAKESITDTLLEKVRKNGSPTLYTRLIKYNASLEANKTAQYNYKLSQEENATAIREKKHEKFENTATEYENRIGLTQNKISDLDNQISIIETKGQIIGAAYYKNKIDSEKELLNTLNSEKIALIEQHAQMESGTQEWYDQEAKIQEVENSIAECTKNMINYRTAIRASRDELAELKKGFIGLSTAYLNTAESYNSRYEMTDKDTGDLTDHGLAAMGIYQKKITNAANSQSVDQEILNSIIQILNGYGAAADKQAYLNKNNYDSIEQVRADYQKYYELVQTDISERISGEEQIISLMKERYDADLNYMQTLIDARKNALAKEKELYEYQKSIREKTDQISDIQKQISALRGDGSEATRAKLQSLQANLDSAKNDLMDVEYDKYISDQQEMLDNLFSEYESLIQDIVADVDSLLAAGNAIATENGTKINALTTSIDEHFKTSAPAASASPSADPPPAPSNSGNTPPAPSPANSQQVAEENYKKEMRNKIDRILNSDTFVGMGSANYWEQRKKYTPNEVQKRIFKHGHKRRDYKHLNKKGLVVLAQMLGLGTFSQKNVSSNLLKFFNKVGYSQGGIARSLNKIALANGDDGWITVKRGESVLNPGQTEKFQEFLSNMNPFVDTIKTITSPNSAGYSGKSSCFQQTIGDINLNLELNNVTDTDSFIRQLQTEPRIRKAVSQAVLDPVTGKGILNINRLH